MERAAAPGAEQLSQCRQPLGDRGAIIVDDVVNASTAVLDRRDCRFRRIGNMDERPQLLTEPSDGTPGRADPQFGTAEGFALPP